MTKTLHINIGTQTLSVKEADKIIATYLISSGKNGVGEMKNTGQTPRGWHVIRAKIGSGCAANTVFVGRRATGELYTPDLRVQFPERDWIITRIMWLSGLEPGKNRLGDVDTMRRYIYIHGTPDDVQMGLPGSKGCIRMRNQDIMTLFEQTPAGTRLLIEE